MSVESFKAVAKNQITRVGFKGAAKLIAVSTIENRAAMTVAETDAAAIDLLSYVGSYSSSRIDGKVIFATDRKVG